MFAKIVHFQLYDHILYALDIDGTLWKNTHPPSSTHWEAIPGPTFPQRAKEDRAIENREDERERKQIS